MTGINALLQKGYVYVGEEEQAVTEVQPQDRLLTDVFAAFLKTKEKLSQVRYDVHNVRCPQ